MHRPSFSVEGIAEKLRGKISQMFESFLSQENAGRVESCLRTLQHHRIDQWALVGGLAIEIHRKLLGRPRFRDLNDIDFVTTSFDCIPNTLADDFLFLHVHPFDPPGRTMAQLVDPAAVLRIDVFRTNPAIMGRTVELKVPNGDIRIVALEDLLAQAARLTLPIADGLPVAAKHAKDFLALLKVAAPAKAEIAWADHRRTTDPKTLEEVVFLLRDLISHSSDLLITPTYSQDPTQRWHAVGRRNDSGWPIQG
jgi:hypothetical protein